MRTGSNRLAGMVHEVLVNFRSNKRPGVAGFLSKVGWFGQTGVDYI